VVAAAAPMRRDPLTFEKDLDGLRRRPDFDLVAREAVWDTVKVSVDLDVVIDTDTAHAPFGKAIGLGGQLLEIGPIELFEQGAAGDPEPSERALVVELPQQLADRRIELGQTVKAAMPQPAQQPGLDNQHCGLDFGLVARPARPCRQDRGVVMRRHLGVSAIPAARRGRP
jgi:hypothetical protein